MKRNPSNSPSGKKILLGKTACCYNWNLLSKFRRHLCHRMKGLRSKDQFSIYFIRYNGKMMPACKIKQLLQMFLRKDTSCWIGRIINQHGTDSSWIWIWIVWWWCHEFFQMIQIAFPVSIWQEIVVYDIRSMRFSNDLIEWESWLRNQNGRAGV